MECNPIVDSHHHTRLVSFLGNSVSNTDRQRQADKGGERRKKRKEKRKNKKTEGEAAGFLSPFANAPQFIHPIIIIIIIIVIVQQKEDSPILLKFLL